MDTAVIPVKAVKEEYFAEENLYGRVLCETKYATAVLARLEPNQAQTHHFQVRPGEGDEVIFVFSGTFEVKLRDRLLGPFAASPESPICVYVKSGDEASIRNLANADLTFFTFLAPPYKDGEINYLPKR